MTISAIVQLIGSTGILLTTPVALPMECQMTQAPIINVIPKTKNIEYDLTKTSAQLFSLTSSTISPYGLNVDQTTGGLRHDRPTLRTEIKFNATQNQATQALCLSYNTVNVTIDLQPKIYIAKEFNKGMCARKVMEHEKKHVTVDRKVINKYSKLMGQAIQKSVNEAGAVGPFPKTRVKEMQEMMSEHIKSAISSVQLSMANEMNQLQQQVDSLEEYERVGEYCKRQSKKAFSNKQKALQKKNR